MEDRNYLFNIKKLSSYNKKSINLENVSINLKESQIHSIVGSRGAGAKVFLEVLTGNEKNISGEVIYNGKDITSELSIYYNNEIMFFLNKFMLANNLTVAENIFLIQKPEKIFKLFNKYKLNRQAKELLDKLNININVKEYVYDLTTEQKKLIQIAKIFHFKPQVVIMYDPTKNLSLQSVNILYNVMRKMVDEGTGIIYITPKWEESLKISDKISVFYEGELAGDIDSSEATQNPQKLLKMMSGWNNIYSDNKEENHLQKESNEVLDAIFKAAEFLTSNYELNDVLKMICSYACKIMSSDGGIIYLVDEHTNTIMNTVNKSLHSNMEARLNNEVVIEIMKENDVYYKNIYDHNFVSLFSKLKNVETVICYPVLIRSNYTALLQVYYKKHYAYTKNQLKYFSALARQAAIAIDNTRLMGKSTLIQETHHRIKNNLQTIIGLITMQKNVMNENTEKRDFNDLIDDITGRIKSIASVHDVLSKDKTGRSITNFKKIIEVILDFYMINNNYDIKLDLDDIFIPYNKATSISLIINELVNNCVKHAFSYMETGKIEISCTEMDEEVVIIVRDNGIGLAEDFDINNMKNLGLSIVCSIVKNEFNGEINVFAENGTVVKISLPKKNILITNY